MRTFISLLLACCLVPAGCADEGAMGDTGSLTLGLRDSVSGWFHVKIYEKAPTKANMTPNVVFETGCIDAKSQTYELNNIPSGDGLVVEIASFGSAECSPESRAEVGYRGMVDIKKGEDAPYYHVPLFQQGASTAFPEDINISASIAEPIDFCDSDSQCAEFSDNHVCYDGQSPNYWCVPACSDDSDCTSYHPGATCDAETSWCTLQSPYPLNLSSPRAMGHAATLKDGSVAFIGGFGSAFNGRMISVEQAIEVFDVGTGLFHKKQPTGLDDWTAAMSGMAKLPDGRIVLVGGVRSAELSYEVAGNGAVRIIASDLAAKDCTSDPCLPNIRNELVILDMEKNTASVNQLPIPLAASTVLSLGQGKLLVAGGLAPSFGGLGSEPNNENLATDRAWIVQVASDSTVTVEEVGTMTVPRVGAAALCQNSTCDSVLILGGNREGSVAEVMSTSDGEVIFVPVTIDGLPGTIANPTICGDALVGGQGVKPAQLKAVDGNWTATMLENGDFDLTQLAATATSANGDCWVVGGLEAGGPTDAVFRVSNGAVAPKQYEASRARFGAMAAPIGSGLLEGGLIFGGGVELGEPEGNAGALEWVRGAEIILP